MSEPTGSRDSRPTVTLRIVETVVGTIRALVVGAALIIPGAFWLKNEIESKSGHNAHVYMAVGLMVLGGIAINPPFGDKLTAIFVQVFPNGLPLIGGRRATDPPKP